MDQEQQITNLTTKIGLIHDSLIELKTIMQSSLVEAQKTNGRVSKVEKEVVQLQLKDEQYFERFKAHMDADEKHEKLANERMKGIEDKVDKLDRKVDSLAIKIYIAMGVMTAVSTLLPYILPKLLGQ